jgi:NADPH:quinone reductase-like Zn-dependent oxidoreductase
VEPLPLPALGPQDVLVRMLAAPVNPADLNQIQARACSTHRRCTI